MADEKRTNSTYDDSQGGRSLKRPALSEKEHVSDNAPGRKYPRTMDSSDEDASSDHDALDPSCSGNKGDVDQDDSSGNDDNGVQDDENNNDGGSNSSDDDEDDDSSTPDGFSKFVQFVARKMAEGASLGLILHRMGICLGQSDTQSNDAGGNGGAALNDQILQSLRPANDEGSSDDNAQPFLPLGVLRAVWRAIGPSSGRPKLSNVNTMEHACELLATCSNILVVTGAGVSVAAGIPDFRSRGGLYSMIAEKYDLSEPEQMFDIERFRMEPDLFYSIANKLYPGEYSPTRCHHFIRCLEERQKLLRNYTQNIDTLEQKANISKVYQCHGSFHTASCITCGHKVDGSTLAQNFREQKVAFCEKCDRAGRAGENEMKGEWQGVMKPDIVFFGQALDDGFHQHLVEDRTRVDLVVIIGSSLQVQPVAGLFGMLPPEVPTILINRETVGRPHKFDVELLGDCQTIVTDLCARLQWPLVEDMPAPLPIEEFTPDKEPSETSIRFVRPHQYHYPSPTTTVATSSTTNPTSTTNSAT